MKDISKDLLSKVQGIIKNDVPSYIEENKKYNESLKKKAISRPTVAPAPLTSVDEAEQIDEVSKETLGKYIIKSANRAAVNSEISGYHDGRGDDPVTSKKYFDKSIKRQKGIAKAIAKLVKK